MLAQEYDVDEPPHPLVVSAELGVLKYLQFYNLTCNDCGGWKSNRCINGTSCTLPVSNCTCADTVAETVPNTTVSNLVQGVNTTAAGDNATAIAVNSTSGDNSTDSTADSGTVAPARRLAQTTTTSTCNYTQFS